MRWCPLHRSGAGAKRALLPKANRCRVRAASALYNRHMCLVTVAWGAHPDYRLVFAGNRDEFHDRPAAPAGWWPDTPAVLGGRDLRAGGSWLGISRSGRIAVVTNQPGLEQSDTAQPSRGALVTNFLTSAEPVDAYATALARKAGVYSGFGLVIGDLDQMRYVAHEDRPGNIVCRVLDPGYVGLSNASYGTDWPKIGYLKSSIAELLEQHRVSEVAIFELLENRRPQSPGPFANPLTKMQATPFILGEQYGTRSATVIIVDSVGNCRFTERRYDVAGRVSGETTESFTISPLS